MVEGREDVHLTAAPKTPKNAAQIIPLKNPIDELWKRNTGFVYGVKVRVLTFTTL